MIKIQLNGQFIFQHSGFGTHTQPVFDKNQNLGKRKMTSKFEDDFFSVIFAKMFVPMCGGRGRTVSNLKLKLAKN